MTTVLPTRDELLAAIEAALADRNMPAVASLVGVLAVVAPADAELFLTVLDLAGAS